jgi:hypothetical protein
VLSWRAGRAHPEAALATALVLGSVAHPVAWVMHGWRVWALIVIPLRRGRHRRPAFDHGEESRARS